MAKTVKKAPIPTTKTTAAPTAAKAAPAATKKIAGAESKIHLMPASHEQIAALAHKYWAERGHQHGKAEEDWLRAEQELRGKAS